MMHTNAHFMPEMVVGCCRDSVHWEACTFTSKTISFRGPRPAQACEGSMSSPASVTPSLTLILILNPLAMASNLLVMASQTKESNQNSVRSLRS